MNNTQNTQADYLSPALDRFGKRYIIKTFFAVLISAAVLFLFAGRFDWTMGLVFIGLHFSHTVVSNVILGRYSPELLNERGRKADNSKDWDRVLTAIWIPMMYIAYAVAGLDAGRFGWSSMQSTLSILGVVMLVVASIIITWAMNSNPYFYATVRIQEERGHQTITSGPYQYVRHPGYVGAILWIISAPLVLGSWWALIPGGLTAALLIVRTALEDRSLQAELTGYAEYAGRVRYRLLPGVW